jgi:hypothetical protein
MTFLFARNWVGQPRGAGILLVLALSAYCAPCRAALPVVDQVHWKTFRNDCRRLLKASKALKAPWAAEIAKALQPLLAEGEKKPAAAVAGIQKLLDRRCLVGVTINPESRVKVQRGPAPAGLRLGRETLVLIKVVNQAGVTHALKVSSPQFRTKNHTGGARWLEAVLHTQRPLRKTLSGRPVEYVVLGLTPREKGKREATLTFDVGQGTQDLGFRAELPVLFKIGGKKK